jgi:hypothetical protein
MNVEAVMTGIENELRNTIHQLPLPQQQQVLEYARSLAKLPLRGVPGASLLRFAGAIEADDLALMKQVIEAGCEKVNKDEW